MGSSPGFAAGGALVAALSFAAAAMVLAVPSGGGAAPRDRATTEGGGERGPRSGRLRALPETRSRLRGSGDETRCAACHQTQAWEKVRFNHDPTGFPLRGAHTGVTCKGCHAGGFGVPVADTCAGCHRDRHAGQLGTQCEGCHDDQSWRPLFQADAHRRTNFPLTGKHGLIPCTQCHGNLRDRSFSQAPVRCVSCHQTDFEATRLSSVDHVAAAFSTECQGCHSTLRFWPARLPQHGACFRIGSGAHHGIRCLGCHSSLPSVAFSGACATGTFLCSGCHEHACERSVTQHQNVMGYECADAKCYECHKLTGQ